MTTRLNEFIQTQFRPRPRRSGALRAVTRQRATKKGGAVVGSVLLGAASGLRSQLGVATVVARSDRSLPPILRQPWTKRLLVAAAAGELVADKLPATPSRLSPVGIAGRLALGALAAALYARTRQAPWIPAAAIGGSSAVVTGKAAFDLSDGSGATAPAFPESVLTTVRGVDGGHPSVASAASATSASSE